MHELDKFKLLYWMFSITKNIYKRIQFYIKSNDLDIEELERVTASILASARLNFQSLEYTTQRKFCSRVYTQYGEVHRNCSFFLIGCGVEPAKDWLAISVWRTAISLQFSPFPLFQLLPPPIPPAKRALPPKGRRTQSPQF